MFFGREVGTLRIKAEGEEKVEGLGFWVLGLGFRV